MENIVKNAANIDVDQVTESGQQVVNGASDTVKTIGDYFGVDTIIIWLVALMAIIFVWRVFRKIGKVALVFIIVTIIIAAIAGPFFI